MDHKGSQHVILNSTGSDGSSDLKQIVFKKIEN
jgi:hypothetical protein